MTNADPSPSFRAAVSFFLADLTLREVAVSPDLIFAICNYGVLPAWALLVLTPRWRLASELICPVIVPGLLGTAYVALIVSQWRNLEGSFNSLRGVETLFTNRYALLGGWIHYLAFDLFIGSWELRDSQRLGIRHRFVVPCLALTLLFGPAGLLTYFGVRAAVGRTARIRIESDPVVG